MKKNSRKGEIILAIAIIALLGAAAVLNLVRSDNHGSPHTTTYQHASMWTAAYSDTDFASLEIRELVRELQDISRTDRNPERLRPVIIQLGVHLRQISDPVPPVVADLLRDLAVEHPVRDIRLMAYTTMISALQNEAGQEGIAIGFASR